MILDILNRYSHAGIRLKYFIEKVSECYIYFSVVGRLAGTYFLIGSLGCVTLEGSLTGNYFDHKDAEAPNVHWEGMASTSN